jgi:hypothetical protein
METVTSSVDALEVEISTVGSIVILKADWEKFDKEFQELLTKYRI